MDKLQKSILRYHKYRDCDSFRCYRANVIGDLMEKQGTYESNLELV